MAVYNPYAAQEADIARRRHMADVLEEQAFKPIQQFNYNGIPAPISPLSGLAKVLSSYGAGKLEREATAAETKLGANRTAARARSVDMLASFMAQTPAPAVVGTPATPGTDPSLGTTFEPVAEGHDPAERPVVIPGTMGTPAVLGTSARPGGVTLAQALSLEDSEIQGIGLGLAKDELDRAQARALAKPDLVEVTNPDGSKRLVPRTPGLSTAPPESGLGNSMQARAVAFLLDENNDPASAAYRAAYNIVAQPSFTFDPRTGAPITTTPDMSAYRPLPGAKTPESRVVGSAPTPPLTTAQRTALDEVNGGLATSADVMKIITENPAAFTLDVAMTARLPFGRGAAAIGPEMVEARAAIASFRSAIQKSLSGATVTDSEKAQLDKFLPDDYDDAATLLAKARAYRRYLEVQLSVMPGGPPPSTALPPLKPLAERMQDYIGAGG